MRTLYYCDPEKAKATCSRTHCKSLGCVESCACDATSHAEYVKRDVNGKPMVKVKLPERYGVK